LVQENVGIIIILLRKWCYNDKNFAELAKHHGKKNRWHGYGM